LPTIAPLSLMAVMPLRVAGMTLRWPSLREVPAAGASQVAATG
jgi:hypothetical protein